MNNASEVNAKDWLAHRSISAAGLHRRMDLLAIEVHDVKAKVKAIAADANEMKPEVALVRGLKAKAGGALSARRDGCRCRLADRALLGSDPRGVDADASLKGRGERPPLAAAQLESPRDFSDSGRPSCLHRYRGAPVGVAPAHRPRIRTS